MDGEPAIDTAQPGWAVRHSACGQVAFLGDPPGLAQAMMTGKRAKGPCPNCGGTMLFERDPRVPGLKQRGPRRTPAGLVVPR